MREHPILFSGPMVRAILEGRKTQTRRVVKLPRAPNNLGHWEPFWFGGKGCRDARGNEISGTWTIGHTRTGAIVGCPYGQPGDRLWCRETWAETDRADGVPVVTYAAGGCIAVGRKHGCADDYLIHDYALTETPEPDRWRPSIHMPRWASRITLEITDVRVQRVREISEEDAIAEGIRELPPQECLSGERRFADPFGNPSLQYLKARAAFAMLWDSINAKRGFGWNENPYVWALTFKRVEE